jgi:hypothetical protein
MGRQPQGAMTVSQLDKEEILRFVDQIVPPGITGCGFAEVALKGRHALTVIGMSLPFIPLPRRTRRRSF